MLKFNKRVGEKEAVLLSGLGEVRTNNRGFTLLEIMITVGIIGVLAAIAIPNFVNARARTQNVNCSNNIRQFEAAKAQYALECGLRDGNSIEPASALDAYLVNLTVDTVCPGGGTYIDIAAIGTTTTCTIHSN